MNSIDRGKYHNLSILKDREKRDIEENAREFLNSNERTFADCDKFLGFIFRRKFNVALGVDYLPDSEGKSIAAIYFPSETLDTDECPDLENGLIIMGMRLDEITSLFQAEGYSQWFQDVFVGMFYCHEKAHAFRSKVLGKDMSSTELNSLTDLDGNIDWNKHDMNEEEVFAERCALLYFFYKVIRRTLGFDKGLKRSVKDFLSGNYREFRALLEKYVEGRNNPDMKNVNKFLELFRRLIREKRDLYERDKDISPIGSNEPDNTVSKISRSFELD